MSRNARAILLILASLQGKEEQQAALAYFRELSVIDYNEANCIGLSLGLADHV